MAISTRLSAVRFRRWSPFPAGEVSNLALPKATVGVVSNLAYRNNTRQSRLRPQSCSS